jgi:hypothetical protein
VPPDHKPPQEQRALPVQVEAHFIAAAAAGSRRMYPVAGLSNTTVPVPVQVLDTNFCSVYLKFGTLDLDPCSCPA